MPARGRSPRPALDVSGEVHASSMRTSRVVGGRRVRERLHARASSPTTPASGERLPWTPGARGELAAEAMVARGDKLYAPAAPPCELDAATAALPARRSRSTPGPSRAVAHRRRDAGGREAAVRRHESHGLIRLRPAQRRERCTRFSEVGGGRGDARRPPRHACTPAACGGRAAGTAFGGLRGVRRGDRQACAGAHTEQHDDRRHAGCTAAAGRGGADARRSAARGARTWPRSTCRRGACSRRFRPRIEGFDRVRGLVALRGRARQARPRRSTPPAASSRSRTAAGRPRRRRCRTGRRRSTLAGASGAVSRARARRARRCYVGGEYLALGGERERSYLGAIDLRSGRVTAWDPDPNDEVAALEIGRGTLYAGGQLRAGSRAAALRGWRRSTRTPASGLASLPAAAGGWDGRGTGRRRPRWRVGRRRPGRSRERRAERGSSASMRIGRLAGGVPLVEGYGVRAGRRGRAALHRRGALERRRAGPRRAWRPLGDARQERSPHSTRGPTHPGWSCALAALPRGGLLAGGYFSGTRSARRPGWRASAAERRARGSCPAPAVLLRRYLTAAAASTIPAP